MINGIVKMQVQHPGTSVVFPIGTAQDTMRAWVESKDLDSGDPRASKIVAQIVSEVLNRSPSLKLMLYGRNTLTEDRVLMKTITLEQDSGKMWTKGVKYLSLMLEDLTVSTVWRVVKIYIMGESGGGRR